MSHEISNIDRQEGVAMAWHKLTHVRQHIGVEDCWLSQWDVRKSHLFKTGGAPSDWFEIVATDNPDISVGEPVGDSYGVIGNADFLALVKECMSSIAGSRIVSCGSVCERARIFVAVEVPEVKEFIAAGRKFLPYLNFMSSHDQSAPLLVNAGTIAPVCNNTFNANLMDTSGNHFRTKVRHTKNAHSRLPDVQNMVDAYMGTQARFRVIMDNMAECPVPAGEAKGFFSGLLSGGEVGEQSTRRSNQVNRLTELFFRGAGNHGNNRADLFSAVTDYYSHESSGSVGAFKQIASSEYGFGQDMKSRAFEVLSPSSGGAYADVVSLGNKILQN